MTSPLGLRSTFPFLGLSVTKLLIFEKTLDLKVFGVDIALIILERNPGGFENVGDKLGMESAW